VGHASGSSFFPGKTAVETFYIISGFYMSLILNEKYLKKKNSYKLFITNRFLRLFPSYWVVLLITITFSLVIYHVTDHRNGASLSAYFSYSKNLDFASFAFLTFTNICVFFQDMVCFLGLDKHSGALYFNSNFYSSDPPLYTFLIIAPAWTIGLELTYYLIAPFIVKRALYIVLILMALSLITRVVLIKMGLSHDPWNYRFFPNEILFFLMGNISYRIYVFIKKRLGELNYSPFILKTIFFVVVLFTVFYNLTLSHVEPKYIELLYFTLFFCALPFIFLLTKKSKLDRFIGELSYPIYISHMLMIQVCKYLNVPQGIAMDAAVAILSVLFAVLINKLLNDRIEQYRQKRVSAEKTVVSG